MRKNFGGKSWLYPMPVLIVAAYDEHGKANAMNAAWGGIFTDEHIGICISEGHKTTKNILATKAFTVSMATVEQLIACDYVGIVSGNDVPDKLQRAGWHATKSELVDAPLFDELPVALECTVLSYDTDTCRLVGRIENLSADERVLDARGKIDLSRFSPIVYDPVGHGYYRLGDKVGQAFSDGKKLK